MMKILNFKLFGIEQSLEGLWLDIEKQYELNFYNKYNYKCCCKCGMKNNSTQRLSRFTISSGDLDICIVDQTLNELFGDGHYSIGKLKRTGDD